MVPEWLAVVSVVVSPAFAAGGAYFAVVTRLAWLRRDVDKAHERIEGAHERIDELFSFTRTKRST